MSLDQTNRAAPDLAKLEARSNLLLALYTHLAHDLEQTQRERDRLNTELAETQNELARARIEIEHRGKVIAHKDAELEHSAARIADMEHRHAVLLSSTSWRVSAPIRALGRLTKRAP
jgi:hypothetical protein